MFTPLGSVIFGPNYLKHKSTEFVLPRQPAVGRAPEMVVGAWMGYFINLLKTWYLFQWQYYEYKFVILGMYKWLSKTSGEQHPHDEKHAHFSFVRSPFLDLLICGDVNIHVVVGLSF